MLSDEQALRCEIECFNALMLDPLAGGAGLLLTCWLYFVSNTLEWQLLDPIFSEIVDYF
jgi:hypothetical protein